MCNYHWFESKLIGVEIEEVIVSNGYKELTFSK